MPPIDSEIEHVQTHGHGEMPARERPSSAAMPEQTPLELKQGMTGPQVKRWQTFLRNMPRPGGGTYYSGPLDGGFSARLATATNRFQRDHGISATGGVDKETAAAAAEKGYRPELQFKMGPDFTDDLRKCRPYFLIPLREQPPERERAEQAELVARIRKYVCAMERRTNGNPAVTDVFVFSHGWHRNFYSAIAAYDRLISRYARLVHAGRFDDPQQDGCKPSKGQGFHPLFLNLHWHSDPGEDGFVDKSGRRDKQSFLQAVKGGLLVANVARALALGKGGKSSLKSRPGTDGQASTAWTQESIDHIDTLCLVQGALASDWFEEEPTLARFVTAGIGCVYSRYDTANGVYYPVANGSRCAAGYVGLTKIAGDASVAPTHRERFVLLVRPPDLDASEYLPPGVDATATQAPSSKAWNLDASRIIYQGPPALGGGHDDLFKDDVVHLLWAVRTLPARCKGPAQTPLT